MTEKAFVVAEHVPEDEAGFWLLHPKYPDWKALTCQDKYNEAPGGPSPSPNLGRRDAHLFMPEKTILLSGSNVTWLTK
jgi:hypothetical protein